MVDSVLFDLDGTLWDATPGVTRTWNKALFDLGFKKVCTVDEVRRYMGMTLDKICSSMLGDEDPEKVRRLFDAISGGETEGITLEGASLFPEERETLALLARRYRLFIVSNCGRGYIEHFLDLFDLGGYFTDLECFGGTGLPKGENIKIVCRRNALASPVYVGDTEGDRLAAFHAGVPFIHAAYGFGEVASPDHAIFDLRQLPTVLEKI